MKMLTFQDRNADIQGSTARCDPGGRTYPPAVRRRPTAGAPRLFAAFGNSRAGVAHAEIHTPARATRCFLAGCGSMPDKQVGLLQPKLGFTPNRAPTSILQIAQAGASGQILNEQNTEIPGLQPSQPHSS